MLLCSYAGPPGSLCNLGPAARPALPIGQAAAGCDACFRLCWGRRAVALLRLQRWKQASDACVSALQLLLGRPGCRVQWSCYRLASCSDAAAECMRGYAWRIEQQWL